MFNAVHQAHETHAQPPSQPPPHGDATAVAPDAPVGCDAQAAAALADPSKQSAAHDIVERESCKNFSIAFSYGNRKCWWAHDVPPPSLVCVQQTSLQVCRHFAMTGYCNLGSACYFRH